MRTSSSAGVENRLNFKPGRREEGRERQGSKGTQYEENIPAISGGSSSNKKGSARAGSIYVARHLCSFVRSNFGRSDLPIYPINFRATDMPRKRKGRKRHKFREFLKGKWGRVGRGGRNFVLEDGGTEEGAREAAVDHKS